MARTNSLTGADRFNTVNDERPRSRGAATTRSPALSDIAKDYVFADAAPSAELKRLREIDSYMRSMTEARITRLGIAPGWQCLEVGAGAVARWMAEKVGKTGSVTATDIAPKVDLDPHLPWLEARRHNILEPGLEDSRYDLVHCRLLLVHVSPVEVALQNMVRALRPGGWLVIEEPGDLKISEVGEDDLRVAECNRLHEEFLASISMITSKVDLTLFRDFRFRDGDIVVATYAKAGTTWTQQIVAQ
jgi:SAM-dependent methyltransferase